jgi:cell division protein FtsB
MPPWAAWTAAALALLIVGGRGLQALARNYWDLREAQLEQESLQDEQAELARKLQLLKTDDAHLERVARKELGLMKPKEVEYRFRSSQQQN